MRGLLGQDTVSLFERMAHIGESGLFDTSRLIRPNLFPNISPRNVTEPTIKRTRSYDVNLEVGKLQHRHSVSIGKFFAVFPQATTAKSFSIDYTLHCDELPDSTTGVLHVKLES